MMSNKKVHDNLWLNYKLLEFEINRLFIEEIINEEMMPTEYGLITNALEIYLE
jgi:hypothetical protein